MRNRAFSLVLVFASIASACERSAAPPSMQTLFGPEKSALIVDLQADFDQFLTLSFRGDSEQERMVNFLSVLDTASYLFQPHWSEEWSADSTSAKKLLKRFESTGLRQDILLHTGETYDTSFAKTLKPITPPKVEPMEVYHGTLNLELEPLDSALYPVAKLESREKAEAFEREMAQRNAERMHFNHNGRYLYALNEYYRSDSTVASYIDAKMLQPNTSIQITLSELLQRIKEAKTVTPGLRLILLFEVYIPYLQSLKTPS